MIDTQKAADQLVINTDGGSRGNPGPASWAFVAKIGDSNSTVGTEYGYLGRATNNVAEYQAIIQALKYAVTRPEKKILFQCDSELIVRQLWGDWKVKHKDMLELWAEASVLIEELAVGREVHLRHVRREFNTEADALCNKCLDENKGK